MRREPAASDDLARRLTELVLALGRADDDLASLAAVLPMLADPRLEHVLLERVLLDPDAPPGLVPVAHWRPGDPAPQPAHGPPLAPPDTLDPQHEPTRSVLPLHHRERWHGRLTLRWSGPRPHDPDPLTQLLGDALSAALAARDELAAHRHAMTGLAALLRVSERIARAADDHALLAALIAESPVPGVQGKLLTITSDPDGTPRTVTAVAVHGGDPGLPTTLGQPVSIADDAISPLWLASPNAAIYLGDLRDHPHPGAREGRRRSGLVAAVLIPLRWRDRWLGLVQLGWSVPRQFTGDERRLHAELAPHLAAVLDNRLLTRRCEQALADQRDQARTLEIVLDHLPVGVQIHDPVRAERRFNRAAQELLRAHLSGDPSALPLYHPGSDERVSPDERLSRMAIASGQQVARERDLQEPDGTRVRLSVTAAPVRDEHGSIIAAVTLFHDISARVAAERARSELRDAVVAAQRIALRERSTPLIPIDDEVLVLPLIGAIDPERARQIVDTLAELRGHPRARVVLLDLTGVRDLDEHGARALVEAARVLRLRGARAILTGIGGEVAWTLAHLELDLRGVATHATLQTGLAHAR